MYALDLGGNGQHVDDQRQLLMCRGGGLQRTMAASHARHGLVWHGTTSDDGASSSDGMAATQLAATYGGQPYMAVVGSVWGIVSKDGASSDDGFSTCCLDRPVTAVQCGNRLASEWHLLVVCFSGEAVLCKVR